MACNGLALGESEELLGLISKTGTECVVVLIPVVFCNLDDLQQE